MELVKKTFLFKVEKEGYRFWQMLNTCHQDGICDRILREYFHIPESITRIVISLHDRSAKNRVRATIDNHYGYPAVYVGLHCVSSIPLDRLLGLLVGRTVYVDVEYME